MNHQEEREIAWEGTKAMCLWAAKAIAVVLLSLAAATGVLVYFLGS